MHVSDRRYFLNENSADVTVQLLLAVFGAGAALGTFLGLDLLVFLSTVATTDSNEIVSIQQWTACVVFPTCEDTGLS